MRVLCNDKFSNIVFALAVLLLLLGVVFTGVGSNQDLRDATVEGGPDQVGGWILLGGFVLILWPVSRMLNKLFFMCSRQICKRSKTGRRLYVRWGKAIAGGCSLGPAVTTWVLYDVVVRDNIQDWIDGIDLLVIDRTFVVLLCAAFLQAARSSFMRHALNSVISSAFAGKLKEMLATRDIVRRLSFPTRAEEAFILARGAGVRLEDEHAAVEADHLQQAQFQDTLLFAETVPLIMHDPHTGSKISIASATTMRAFAGLAFEQLVHSIPEEAADIARVRVQQAIEEGTTADVDRRHSMQLDAIMRRFEGKPQYLDSHTPTPVVLSSIEQHEHAPTEQESRNGALTHGPGSTDQTSSEQTVPGFQGAEVSGVAEAHSIETAGMPGGAWRKSSRKHVPLPARLEEKHRGRVARIGVAGALHGVGRTLGKAGAGVVGMVTKLGQTAADATWAVGEQLVPVTASPRSLPSHDTTRVMNRGHFAIQLSAAPPYEEPQNEDAAAHRASSMQSGAPQSAAGFREDSVRTPSVHIESHAPSGADDTHGTSTSAEDPLSRLDVGAGCGQRARDAILKVSGEEPLGLLDIVCTTFDTNRDGEVSKTEFVAHMEALYLKFRDSQRNLHGQAAVSQGLTIIANIVVAVIMLCIVLGVYELSVSAVVVPLASLLVASGFALGPSIQAMLSSLMMILGTRPFDVGDRIVVWGVADNGPLVVQRIDIMTSTFVQALTNKPLQMQNSKLATAEIENHSRSRNAQFAVDVMLPLNIKAELLAALQNQATRWIKQRPLDWKPELNMRIGDVQPAPNQCMKITFWVTHRSGWSDVGIFAALSSFRNALKDIIDTLHIQYMLPPQRFVGDNEPDPKDVIDTMSGSYATSVCEAAMQQRETPAPSLNSSTFVDSSAPTRSTLPSALRARPRQRPQQRQQQQQQQHQQDH